MCIDKLNRRMQFSFGKEMPLKLIFTCHGFEATDLNFKKDQPSGISLTLMRYLSERFDRGILGILVNLFSHWSII